MRPQLWEGSGYFYLRTVIKQLFLAFFSEVELGNFESICLPFFLGLYRLGLGKYNQPLLLDSLPIPQFNCMIIVDQNQN
jgi:hypothetical protein